MTIKIHGSQLTKGGLKMPNSRKVKNILVKTWKTEDERLSIKTSLMLKKVQHPNNDFIQCFCDKAIKELDRDYKEV